MTTSPSRQAHVLYVESAPGFGGSTRCVLELARSCVRRGMRVTLALAAPLPAGEATPVGVELMALGGPTEVTSNTPRAGDASLASRIGNVVTAADRLIQRDWPLVRRLASYIRDQRVDLIHANNELISNRVAIGAGALTAVPVISHQRGWGRKCLMSRVLAHGVWRFVAISRAVEKDLLRIGIPANRVVHIYDGVKLNSATDSEADRHRIRNSFGWGGRELVVAFPAVLTPWKGQRLFLEAFAAFAKQVPQARALLLGGPLASEPCYPQELREWAAKLQIADRVHFAGHIADMGPHYHAADIVVHGSLRPEPLGLVVLEAMAAGRPVIAAAAGGPAEIMTHGQEGLLYRMGDPSALYQSMLQLAGDPKLRDRLGHAATARARDFRQDNCDAAIADLYGSVLGEATLGPRGRYRWRSRPYYSCSASSPLASAPSTCR